VSIKVETFTFTRYGLIHGKVIDVSRDSVVAADTGANAPSASPTSDLRKESQAPASPTYVARISLDRADMMVDGRRQPLLPGMAVTAEIKTGRRSIIDYLLSPIARRSSEAMRER
jgi:hemolysin D